MSELLNLAIKSVDSGICSFCRYITGNDTGKTGSHQAGFYIPKEAARILFETPVHKGENRDKMVEIKWQNDFTTQSRFVYYGTGTRNEFRITRFGKNFPMLDDEHVGDLLILVQHTVSDYEGYVLSEDEDIDDFLATFNLSPDDTNQLIRKELKVPQNGINDLMDLFISNFKDFPDTVTMADGARDCFNNSNQITKDMIAQRPDQILLKWVDAEYTLFQKMEDKIYASIIGKAFTSVSVFTETANKILNRRKSRAGKSLEHHLSSVFDACDIIYEEQVVTEENKKPDFIFPNGECYHNFEFPADLLVSLAAKTTCKDRWRQVINEANRIGEKHLFTLQQAISRNQLKEMADENVHLIVPQKYKKNYPEEYRENIWDLETFIAFVKETQSKTPRHYFVK
jgi:hypothetical protein